MDKARPCGSGAPGSEGQQLRSAGRPGPSRGSVSPKAPPVGDQTAVIKNVDMSEEVQQHAVECAIVAIEKYNVEREIAALIKRVAMGDQMVVIKDTDVSEEMQQDAVECTIWSLEEYNAERDVAAHVKRISVCS